MSSSPIFVGIGIVLQLWLARLQVLVILKVLEDTPACRTLRLLLSGRCRLMACVEDARLAENVLAISDLRIVCNIATDMANASLEHLLFVEGLKILGHIEVAAEF